MSGIVRAGAVVLQGGEPRVSSHVVASHFRKRHDNVLQAIDRLRVQAADMMRDGDSVAARFHLLNFQETFEIVSVPNGATREDRAFSITEGGFMVLTMGFTGREALRLKILFIEEFKRMRELLASGGGEGLQAQNHAKSSKCAANRLPGALKADSEWVARWIQARCNAGDGLRVRTIEAHEDFRRFVREQGGGWSGRLNEFVHAALLREDVTRIRPQNRSFLLGIGLKSPPEG